ncbi:WD40-repeat-containing domain protein, partial [Obelidium mucronatum]
MVLVKLSPDPLPTPLFASLAFAANGSQVVVSGSTDSVHARVFMTEDLLDGSVAPLALHVAAKRRSGDGGARSVAAQDDCVVVATDSSEALLFSAFAFAFEKTLARLATPIHAARFRPRPNKLLRPHQEAAVAGEDAEIRIVNVDDITRSVVLKGHNDTIKALAFSPDGDFLASVDSLGDLHIWDLRGSKPISMRVLRSVVPATNVDLKDMGRISWHPNGKLLAIPGIHRDISILDTKTWTSVISLSGHSKLVTAVQYNHDGTAIASTDQSGKMYFWNASGKEKTPYKTIKNPSIVTDFSWHPTKNDVCFVLDSFEMEYLKDVGVVSSTVSTKDIAQEMDFETSHTDYKSKRGIDQDDTTRPAAKKTKTITSLDDEFEFDDDEDAAFNDFVVDDDGMGYADPIESRGDARNYYSKQILAPKTKGTAGFGGGYSSGMMLGNGLGGGGTEIQESFQPGATPLKGNKKYLG